MTERPAQTPRSVLAIALALTVAALAGAPAARAQDAGEPPARVLPAPALPQSYLLTPTDQLGTPGILTGTEVTPEGDLYTGWGELNFTLDQAAGFEPRSHTLEGGFYPVVRAFRVDGNVLYELITFQTNVAGRPVAMARVQATNLGRARTRARITASIRHNGGELGPRNQRCCVRVYRFPRPLLPPRDGLYNQPGEEFNIASVYALDDPNTLTRDGNAMLLYPPGGAGVTVTRSLRAGAGVPGPRTPFGQTAYSFALRPRERRALDFKMPVLPLPAASPEVAAIRSARLGAARSQVKAFWRRQLAPAMRISLPERKVTDTFYASLVNDLMSRYALPSGQIVQTVNKLRYQAFWLRDAAFITHSYDLVGLHGAARDALDFFLTWQQPDGLFISRPEQFDGHGQALWAFGDHFRRTGDVAFAQRVLPAVRAAMGYFERQRRADPLGLMPAVNNAPYDNELVNGHLAGDNFFMAAGAQGAIDIARAVGDEALAARWKGELDAFRVNLGERVKAAAARNGGGIPPSLDVQGGQDWGNLWAAYPEPALAPGTAVVRRTLTRVRRKFSEGIATYANRRLLHHYLGFRVFQTELALGEQAKVVKGLYDTLAHTTGTHAGFEAGTAPFGDRIVDDSTVPHGWFAAEYVALLRNMLVRETDDGIRIMSAVSPAWLAPGKRIEVTGAPTTRGRVSFTLRGTATGAVLTWRSRLQAGTRLRWPVPETARDVRARGLNRRTGLITLPSGRSGSLTVSWRLVGRAPTYDQTFANLIEAYFRSPAGAARAAAARADEAATPSDATRAP